MRSVECRSWLCHGSSGWENQLLPHPNQLRNWITLSERVKMISPWRTQLVDLDVFGQWAFLHVRHPAVRWAHSCVRMTRYLDERCWCLLFPDVFCPFFSAGHSGEGIKSVGWSREWGWWCWWTTLFLSFTGLFIYYHYLNQTSWGYKVRIADRMWLENDTYSTPCVCSGVNS